MSRSKTVDYTTTIFQQDVYTALGPGSKYCRTQTQVALFLKKSKSSVSDAVKKLVKLGFIKPMKKGMKKDIFYTKGVNSRIIEEYISIRKKHEIVLSTMNDQGIMCKLPDQFDHVSTIRAHLNGGWLKFIVEKEGKLENIVDPRVSEDHPWAFFKGCKQNNTKGAINYNTHFGVDGDQPVGIRYQKTNRGNKFLYIAPHDMIIVDKQIPSDYHDFSLFYPQCKAVLSWMEKYGGWIIKKDQSHNYYLDLKKDTHSRGIRVEYAFDEVITGALEDVLGNNIGIPGETTLWEDGSDHAQSGDREMETSRIDYVHAINHLPALYRGLEDIKKRVTLLENQKGEGGEVNGY